jgi:energy-coupling factor transporter transmembrane protein EcfT
MEIDKHRPSRCKYSELKKSSLIALIFISIVVFAMLSYVTVIVIIEMVKSIEGDKSNFPQFFILYMLFIVPFVIFMTYLLRRWTLNVEVNKESIYFRLMIGSRKIFMKDVIEVSEYIYPRFKRITISYTKNGKKRNLYMFNRDMKDYEQNKDKLRDVTHDKFAVIGRKGKIG